MKGSVIAAGVLLILVLILSATGCYTVLRHPTGPDVSYRGAYVKSCGDCHTDAQFYHPYYRYGRSHYYWNDYYGHPWWYDDYWWWDHHDGYEGDPPDVERGERHLWSPGGWATGGWGFVKPDGSSSERTTPSKEGEADDSKHSSEQQEAKKLDEKDSDDRNLWKDGKKKGF